MKSHKLRLTQADAVVKTIELLGGIATLGDLNREVLKIEGVEWRTKTPFASIRRIVQLDKRLFKIAPGLYGLTSMKKQLESKEIFEISDMRKQSHASQEFSHSYYQGIITSVGNLKGFETYLPDQDKGKPFGKTQKLGELRKLPKIPPFSYERFINRSKTVDVIWFNHRRMPDSFFEVEHSTQIQNSLLKFVDLQDFNARMLIVSPKQRRAEFEQKMQFEAFREIQERVLFIDYESVVKQYEKLLEESQQEIVL
jgi:hypothetical protein